ncbi:MAG: SDR family NAD(P)-dependent oxidoreductase, partial [Planctomycetota bacterium]
MKQLFNLRGKAVAITGAGGVLCGAIAGALAKAGAKVAVLDLAEDAAKKIAEEIKADGGAAIAIKC